MKKMKELFSTPKKAVISSVCIVLVLIIAGACSIYASENIAKAASIGADKAEYFAFADAGADPAAAEVVRTEFDYEQGQFVYEVEFIYEGTEYEYWIRASDGSVVKKDTEMISSALNKEANTADTQSEADTQAEQENTQPETEQTSAKPEAAQQDTQADAEKAAAQDDAKQSGSQQNAEQSGQKKKDENQNRSDSNEEGIGLEEAKSTALSDAGLTESEVTFAKTKTDYDDGISIYEIEFYTLTHEYEYDIDAVSGEIISKKGEMFKNKNTAGNSGNGNSYIGVDKAKSIAVEHAGFTVKDVTFSKAKLENDDGYTVYEVEFYKDRAEYEYTIDALTGDILEYDFDRN